MSRRELFTDTTYQSLIMHLSSIGSICIATELSANIAFSEQQVTVITVDLAPAIGRESLDMANQAGFAIEVMDFANGQLVLVPSVSHLSLNALVS